MKKLMLVGGGGHCRSVVDSVIELGLYDEIGIVDNGSVSDCGVSLIGCDDDIPELIKAGWTDAIITVGSVGNTELRRKLFSMVREFGLVTPTIIDKTAVVSKEATIGEGVFIGKRAVVNRNATIGDCSIINTGSIVEHDCVVGDFVHISPGTTVCGGTVIGDDTHIGAGSVIIQQINIGSHSVIGAGSVVVKDISSKVKAYGNPCRVVGVE